MKYLLAITMALVLMTHPAHAEEEKNPEFHMLPDGAVHIVGVELWQHHTSNIFSIKILGMKWTIEIPYGLVLLSAYNVPIKPTEMKKGDMLEIKGLLLFSKNLTYYIQPSYIRNLSVQTKPIEQPPIVPVPLPSTSKDKTISPPITPAKKSAVEPAQKGLYMVLKKGYRGGQVSLLQKFLASKGFIPSDSVSGYFGDETENAVKKFQETHALEITGTTGPKTRSLINSSILK